MINILQSVCVSCPEARQITGERLVCQLLVTGATAGVKREECSQNIYNTPISGLTHPSRRCGACKQKSTCRSVVLRIGIEVIQAYFNGSVSAKADQKPIHSLLYSTVFCSPQTASVMLHSLMTGGLYSASISLHMRVIALTG